MTVFIFRCIFEPAIGPEDVPRRFLLDVGLWANKTHDEIWVFDQGYWQKNADLFYEIGKAQWTDIILDADFKRNLRKDVSGFFTSEDIYKKLAIPWKVRFILPVHSHSLTWSQRGIIMHGPPGWSATF